MDLKVGNFYMVKYHPDAPATKLYPVQVMSVGEDMAMVRVLWHRDTPMALAALDRETPVWLGCFTTEQVCEITINPDGSPFFARAVVAPDREGEVAEARKAE